MRNGTPHSVADLTNHNCLGYTLSQIVGIDRWSFGADGVVTVPVSGNLRANNGDALVAAALAGQGLIYQPTFLVSAELRSGRLVTVPLDHPTIELPGIFAVYLSDRRPPAKVRTFIDFLSQRFGPVPPWEHSDDSSLLIGRKPASEDVDHSRTKTKSPQTTGICERFHKTLLKEFYRVAFRKTLYRSIAELRS